MIKFIVLFLISTAMSACTCSREEKSEHENHGSGTFENKQVQIPMPTDPTQPIPTDGPCEANATRVGFLTPYPVNGFPCAAEMQTCDGTRWVGSPLYAKCDPNGGPKQTPQK